MRDKLTEEKEVTKKYFEMVLESSDDINKYVGKIKTIDIDSEDCILTIYKKGSVIRKLRRLGINNKDKVTIKYKQIL